jgi:hypothetical protein
MDFSLLFLPLFLTAWAIQYFWWRDYGLLVILVPVTAGVLLAVNHVSKLEINAGLYHNYPNDGSDVIEDASEKDELSKEYAS